MPGAYTIDETRGLVLSRGWGVLTDDDLLTHARTLVADARFHPHFLQLVDFLGVSDVQVTSTGVQELAAINPFGPGARRALVVSRGAAYGFGRMYQMVRKDDRDELEIFHDLDSALGWLGLADAKKELLTALAKAPEVKALA